MRYHLILDVPISREFKAGVNVLDSTDAHSREEAWERFKSRAWNAEWHSSAYLMDDDEAEADPRGIFI